MFPTHDFGRVAKLLRAGGFLSDLPIQLRPQLTQKTSTSFANRTSWFYDYLVINEDYDSLLRDWKEMATHTLIAAALQIVTEEVIQTAGNCPATVWVESNDKQLADDCNKMLARIKVDDVVQSQVWNLAAYGNNFERLLYTDKEGVMGLQFVVVDNVRRFWNRGGMLLGFSWTEEQPDELHANSITVADTPLRLWYPWEFVHYRRLGQRRYMEYGESYADPARLLYKKLKMVEDAMVVFRANIMPSRYKFLIDTGTADPTEQRNILNEWANELRSIMYVNPAKGSMEQRYDPWALDAFIFHAVKENSKSDVVKLEGDKDIPNVWDVELLTKQLCGALRIPPAYMGFGEGGGEMAKASLVVQDARFARTIKALRKSLIQGYHRLCMIHLDLKYGKGSSKSINPDDIQIKMSPIGILEDEVLVEVLMGQAELMGRLAEVGDAYGFPKREWADYLFRKYFRIPSEVLAILLSNIEAETSPDVSAGGGLPPVLDSRHNGKRKMREVAEKLLNGNAKVRQAHQQIQEVMQSIRAGNLPAEAKLHSPKEPLKSSLKK